MDELDYQNTLDKALSRLRALEIDEALGLFYRLLHANPFDFDIIQRIYPLEQQKKTTEGFNNICRHIFSLESKSKLFHQLIISTWLDFKNKFELSLDPNSFSDKQIFNLFFHLGQTGHSIDCEILKTHITHHFADHPQTPQALFFYSEQLVNRKKLLRAIRELEYLIIYYTEAATTISAENLLKQTRERIRAF